MFLYYIYSYKINSFYNGINSNTKNEIISTINICNGLDNASLKSFFNIEKNILSLHQALSLSALPVSERKISSSDGSSVVILEIISSYLTVSSTIELIIGESARYFIFIV